MGEISDFQVGQTVELQDGRMATVKFAGSTHFATGDWLGVELENASGKNDGAVQGQRYFDCQPSHGMFVRPSVAIVLDQPTPKQNGQGPGKVNGVASKGRPQSTAVSGLRRQSVIDPGAAKRQSINAGSPTPGARVVAASRLGSPVKSPTKQFASTFSSNATRNTTPSAAQRNSSATNKAIRPSVALPLTRSNNVRQSMNGALNGSSRAPGQNSSSSSRVTGNRLSIRPSKTNRFNSVGGDSQASMSSGQDSPAESMESELLSPNITESQDEQTKAPNPSLSRISTLNRVVSFDKPMSSRGRSPPSTIQRGPPTNIASHREVEDLKTKLRVMEKKRLEDREKLKTVERIQTERDKFEGIIQKLQSKYQPQQIEISELKKQLKEDAAKYSILELQQAEHETVVEIATLDREMAEETAESLKTELDVLKHKHEEMELEVEILREENQELGKEMSPEEKTSQGWLQMERSNERLREALMRLRDITQQKEADLQDQVAELEKDLQDLGNIKENFLQAKDKLAQSDSAIEDLRQQLDNALGAEEMIEELTERNFSLNEQLDDLKVAVEDLENLKELNDELDMNHTETEKQMQHEIDYNETLLGEQSRKTALQDETIHDLEYTVTRFRNLVTSMQNDLEDLRASQQITETEANEMTSRSKAMMDLNMQLQVSASKAQVKAIDLELRRLDAQEAAEHLEIVQLFLPETFRTERNSVLAFLSFKRIGSKASMVHGLVKEHANGPVSRGHERDIFSCCDILDKLTWVSCTCDRFIKYIQTTSLEAFARLEGVIHELEPVERAFNGWIDGLKRDELREEQCAVELQRSVALMTHLVELHITDGLGHYADEIQTRALMMQSHLENTAITLSHIKSMSQNNVAPFGNENQDNKEPHDLIRKADSLITQTRSAKVVVSKAIRQLQELKTRALTLEPSTLPSIELAQESTSDLASSTREIGITISRLVYEEGRNAPLTYEEISVAVSPFNTQPFSSLSPKMNSVTTQMQNFYTLANSLNQTIEFPYPPPPPPWLLLAQNMRTETSTSATRESEIERLKGEMAEKNTAVAIRDKTVEELGVKIEVLEKRVGDSGGRRERVRELERIADAAREKEKELLSHVTKLQNNLRQLESERKDWKKPVQTTTSASNHGQPLDIPSASNPASLQEITILKSEIQALQSAVRHLRSISQSRKFSENLDFLSAPLLPSGKPSAALLQSEARDVFKELLHIVTHPNNQMVKLKPRKPEDRLKWRPVRDTTAWKVNRQREEWEKWKEWRDDVKKRIELEEKQGIRKLQARAKREMRDKGRGDAIAKIEGKFGVSGKTGRAVVTIHNPGEWEDAEKLLGINQAD